MYHGPGQYLHYKGGRYEVQGLAFHERSKEGGFEPTDPDHQLVVYRPLSPGSLLEGTAVTFWLRPLADFNAEVDREHGKVPRFIKLGEVHADR